MTTRNRPQVPPGLYAADGSGLLDPDRPSPGDRATKSAARLDAERADSRLLSPFVRQLRAAARRALGGR